MPPSSSRWWSRPTSRSASPSSPTRPGWPARRRRGCSPRWSGTTCSSATGNGAYISGPLFALYAARHDPWSQVARLAEPILEKIGAETGETVNLAVPRSHTVVHIAQVNATYVLGARDWLQVPVPAHCSALGKVLYAFGCARAPRGRAGAADLALPGHARGPAQRDRHHPPPGLRDGPRGARDRARRGRRAGARARRQRDRRPRCVRAERPAARPASTTSGGC